MKKVLGMGNALVDVLVRLENDEILERLGFARGSMTLIDKEKLDAILEMIKDMDQVRSTGGSAANTINGLARFGTPTGYIGKTGEDEFGEFFSSDLAANEIRGHLFNGTQGTGTCVSMISPDSERTMATYLGAAVELDASDLSVELFQGYDYFHIEGYLVQNRDLITQAVKYAKEAGNEIAIDLSSFNVVEDNLDFLEPLISENIDIIFANEEEARAFTGLDDPEKAIVKIAEKCKIAVVKIGSRGSLIMDNSKELIRIPVIEAVPIDTTGAGDLYQSGFFFGLSNDYSLEVCGRLGAVTAGNVVEIIGAKMDDARWEKIGDTVGKIEL